MSMSIAWGSAAGILVRMASRNYVAGPAAEDAQRLSCRLSRQGYWVTQGYWDSGGEPPERVGERYLAALDQLARIDGQNYLSIKLPALNYDPGLFQTILERSLRCSVPLHFDSLAAEHADRIHAFAHEQALATGGRISLTLPGRWRRSLGDADMASSLGLSVRVVKGQWQDAPGREFEPGEGYVKLIDRLAGKVPCVRVATHDLSLAKRALWRLKEAGTPCELELLYGLPQVSSLVALAAQVEVPVRIYIAFGHAFLPYALQSLRKHPAIALHVLLDIFRHDYLSSFPTLPPF